MSMTTGRSSSPLAARTTALGCHSAGASVDWSYRMVDGMSPAADLGGGRPTGGTGLTDWAVATLRAHVADQALAPGAKLPTEQALCGRLGVSRTVVREAVARLKAEGLLTSRRGSGIFVSRDPGGGPAFDLASPQDLSEVLDMLELRLAIEIEAAGLAAERRSTAAMIGLDGAMAGFERAAGGRDGAAEADVDFHRAIAAATGNAWFPRALAQLGRIIPRDALGAQFATEAERGRYLDRLLVEHGAIYEAITAGRAGAARAAMRAHLDGSRRRYRRRLVSQAVEAAGASSARVGAER